VSILVVLEQRDGQVRPVSREALGEASRLAASLGGPVVGVCCAAADPGLAALGAAGADKVLLAAHAAFAQYDAAGYAAAVAAAVKSVAPALVLFSASAMGRDLAPRVAALIGVGLASDCSALSSAGGKLVATRPVYAGKALQKVAFTHAPAMASLRPKLFAAIDSVAGKTAAVEPLAFTWDAGAPRAKVTGLAGAKSG
jgi:electron transfer flavoprotein alpha subunit